MHVQLMSSVSEVAVLQPMLLGMDSTCSFFWNFGDFRVAIPEVRSGLPERSKTEGFETIVKVKRP